MEEEIERVRAAIREALMDQLNDGATIGWQGGLLFVDGEAVFDLRSAAVAAIKATSK